MSPGEHIDVEGQRFPQCIVWTPLPFLTWILPFVGHLGIATSDGIIHDFQGPYLVGRQGKMAFGRVCRYLPVAGASADNWDQGLSAADNRYDKRMHILCWQNCHHHVKDALNGMDGLGTWNLLTLGVHMFLYGRFVSRLAAIKTFGPSFAILAILILYLQPWRAPAE